MTKPKIGLHIEDGLADVYAFATLYDYLVEQNFPAEFVLFCNRLNHIDKFKQCTEVELSSFPIAEEGIKSCDVVLKSYSDVEGHLDYLNDREISIDCSVLKNCTKPLSEEERKKIRQDRGIPEDITAVVMGFHSPGSFSKSKHVEMIVDALKDSEIYFVGCVDAYSNEVKIVDSWGVLKDYYEIADVALMAGRIDDGCDNDILHNFVEATAGGPLFLTEQKSKQYGYKELKNLGVIREAKDCDYLINKIKEYLQNPNGEELRRLRNRHLEISRDIYLKDISRILGKAIGIYADLLESNLLVDIIEPNGKKLPRMRLRHPDTVWKDQGVLKFSTVKISSIPEEVYELFRRAK